MRSTKNREDFSGMRARGFAATPVLRSVS